MTGIFRVDNTDHLLLPGTPSDYLDTPVFADEHAQLLAEKSVMLQILRDRTPLPTTEAREGYFSERHLEYWLSGLRDMRKVVTAAGLDHLDRPRILDFGGASGRVIRHFAGWKPGIEAYLCDINPRHVSLAKQMFGGAVTALHNHGLPTLPLPDDFLDCAVAFSVFTHIDSDDTAWLMELRRVIRPGGHLYVTVHDQSTWNILPDTVIATLSFANADFHQYHTLNRELSGRKVHIYSDAADYACNVFVGRDYIDKVWAPLFNGYSIAPLAHDHQTALIFQI